MRAGDFPKSVAERLARDREVVAERRGQRKEKQDGKRQATHQTSPPI